MVTTVINVLVAGILGAIAIVIVHNVVSAQNLDAMDPALSAIMEIIPMVVGVAVIVGIFVLLTQIRGA